MFLIRTFFCQHVLREEDEAFRVSRLAPITAQLLGPHFTIDATKREPGKFNLTTAELRAVSNGVANGGFALLKAATHGSLGGLRELTDLYET